MNIEEQIKKEGDFEKGKILGMPFVIWRHLNFGHWCGYVGVPNDSKLKGKNYYFHTESENSLSKLERAISDISVHGGLTYAGKLSKEKIKDGLWYFGFDCGHSGDLEPFIVKEYPELASGSYKDKKFVMVEVENLARQLKEIIDLKL